MWAKNFGIKRIGDNDFEFAGPILPMSDEKGEILEYTHNLPAGILPNKYARGPFCTLAPVPFSEGSGVYVITICDNPVYVGECENLSRRFGPEGYRYISRRNCHSDGQSTNCKVNSRILQEYRKGNPVGLWFLRTPDRKFVEEDVIHKIGPAWNGDRIRRNSRISISYGRDHMNTESFRKALEQEFRDVLAKGLSTCVVIAGDLHRKVGGYPGNNHRMQVCCNVMWSLKNERDQVLSSPLKKRGATLKIEYRLPRIGR